MTPPRSMGLGVLTDVIGPERVIGLPVGEVRRLAYDSRQVEPGTLFFAVPGVHVDGHEFVPQAVERGALAVVVERQLDGLAVPQLVVERTRDALADAADAWFGHPSRELHVVGVTGTDGKTTTCFLAAAVLRATGRRPGLIGTVELGIGDGVACGVASTEDPIGPVFSARRLFRLADAAQYRAKAERAARPVVAGRQGPDDPVVRLADEPSREADGERRRFRGRHAPG